MGLSIIRAAALAMAACLPLPASAADVHEGIFALPEGQPKVSASLTATPEHGGRVGLDIAMTPIGQRHPVVRYETELSKQLHVIAISSDFRTFVHEHGDHPAPDGHFRISMPLPHPGRYHVYADGVPAGLGQQVMRFELDVGDVPARTQPDTPRISGFEAADGRYATRFDPFELHAGRESQLSLHLSRNGQPAPDVTPFLGVAAHAVFIDAADLTYVHVHAAPAGAPDAGGTSAALRYDLTGKRSAASTGHEGMMGMAMTSGTMSGMAMPGMEGMSNAPLAAGSPVPPNLTLHVLAPKAGTYLLWLQFMAGSQVRTAPFVVAVI